MDADRSPTTLATGVYLGDDRLQREEQRLFRALPMVVAHASSLARPGDFVTHDLLGVPLLVVRGDDGAVAAYLNVCRHRGTRLESLPCGEGKKSFVCPYHAWTYGKDGQLLGIPHQAGFAGIDRAQRGLVRVPAGEAAGFVWVRASRAQSEGDAVLAAGAWLGEELTADLEGFGVATAHVLAPRAFTRDLNWKLAIDIFLETYHLRTAHKDSIYGIFFDNLGLVDPVGPHLRNVFPKRSIRELQAADEATKSAGLRLHANVLFHLFPNTIVLVQPDHASVVQVWPDGPSRSRMTAYTLVPELPSTDKARAHWDRNNAILYAATDEDYALGESIQRGLASGANEEVVFGAFEHALRHFHEEIGRRLA